MTKNVPREGQKTIVELKKKITLIKILYGFSDYVKERGKFLYSSDSTKNTNCNNFENSAELQNKT